MTWPDGTGVDLVYFASGTAEAGKLYQIKKVESPYSVLSTYAYDSNTGQLSTLSTLQNVTTGLTWDGPALTGVTTTWPNSMSKTAGWVLGDYLRVTSETATGGNAANYTYDNDGLVIDTSALVGFITHHFATPRNPQTGWVDSTVLRKICQTFTHDTTYGQIASVATVFNATTPTTPVHSISLGHDDLGRISTKTETILSGFPTMKSYLYDTAGRLKSQDNGVNNWGYDANGNRTTLNLSVIATYDEQDRLLTFNGTQYSHNANGDRTRKGTGLTATTYGYDSFHNLKTVTFPLGQGSVTYDIDGLGRRVGRHRTGSSPSDRYYLLGEGNRVLAEYDGNGTIVSRFIYATRSHVPDFMIKGTSVYRFITDQLGSVRLVVTRTVRASASTVRNKSTPDFGGRAH